MLTLQARALGWASFPTPSSRTIEAYSAATAWSSSASASKMEPVTTVEKPYTEESRRRQKIRFVLRFARPACRGVSGLHAEGVRESGFISKRKEKSCNKYFIPKLKRKGDLVPIQFSLCLIPFVYLTPAISIDWPRV